jgi:polysaccharide export outer membrane protein
MRILFIVGFVNACANKTTLEQGEEVTVQSSSFSFSPTDFEHLSVYKLAPGDVLDVLFQIQTWEPELAYNISLGDTVAVRFPDLSELDQNQKVLPDGTISMPYIGEIKVYGKTPQQVTQELKVAYKDVLISPSIYVTVPEYLSQIRELKHDLHTSARGLSRLVTVRPDGFVTFPMIGDVFVAAKSLPEINSQINRMYSGISFSLHVDLFLERHSGAKIYVMGEVIEPGAYDITKPVNIIQAIALANGHTDDALLSEIYVIRRKGKNMIATRVNLSETLSMIDSATLFYLLPDDIVYLPATPLSTTAHIARQVADVLFFRGWSVGFSWQLNNADDDVRTIVEP